MRLFNTHTKAFKLTPATTPGKEYRKQLNSRSNMATVVGTILEIGENVQVTEKLVKRTFVLEIPNDNPLYNQQVEFETVNKGTENLDRVHVGDTAEIEYDLRGRRVTLKSGEERVFNTLNAWKITPLNQQEGAYAEMDATEADIF